MKNKLGSIRLATKEDISQMFRVRFAVRENRLATGIVISDEDVRCAIEDTGRGWVIEMDKEIVGFGIADAVTRSIWALFVHPAVEGQGYGQRLYREMVSWLGLKGTEALWLTTQPGTRAQMFYERLGWRVVGPAEDGQVRLELPHGKPPDTKDD